jgi:hypothetical protein
LRSDRVLARSVARPITRFLDIEAAGGILLLAAALTALAWANSPWSASYTDVWSTEISVTLGPTWSSTCAWVNDGLMALFFFVSADQQELRRGSSPAARPPWSPSPRWGMVVPAAIYGGQRRRRRGVAGASHGHRPRPRRARLLGRRVPLGLKVLLLAWPSSTTPPSWSSPSSAEGPRDGWPQRRPAATAPLPAPRLACRCTPCGRLSGSPPRVGRARHDRRRGLGLLIPAAADARPTPTASPASCRGHGGDRVECASGSASRSVPVTERLQTCCTLDQLRRRPPVQAANAGVRLSATVAGAVPGDRAGRRAGGRQVVAPPRRRSAAADGPAARGLAATWAWRDRGHRLHGLDLRGRAG